jgi:hypothetical protein
MGYGPIETVIYNIDKGLSTLGHRSIVACSSDSAVTGEKYGTVPRSLGDYLREASTRTTAFGTSSSPGSAWRTTPGGTNFASESG